MPKHKISESIEMYLITISTLGAVKKSAPLSLSTLAEAMGVQPVSANQMVKKMAEEGWVKYFPYKGVYLTEAGQNQALRVLRHRRLWEIFLVRELKMSVDDADALACQLEHLSSEDVINRLDAFLGHPTISYTGYPIPQRGEDVPLFAGLPLGELGVGDSVQVLRVDGDPLTVKFLSDEGIKPGVQVRIVAVGGGGDQLVESQSQRIHLSAELSKSILVGQPKSAHPEKEYGMTVSLNTLSVGQKGIIKKINFKGAARQRLMAMGLVKGESILVRRVAPLGDPIDFVIKGYDLSLRKSEAEKILVEKQA